MLWMFPDGRRGTNHNPKDAEFRPAARHRNTEILENLAPPGDVPDPESTASTHPEPLLSRIVTARSSDARVISCIQDGARKPAA